MFDPNDFGILRNILTQISSAMARNEINENNPLPIRRSVVYIEIARRLHDKYLYKRIINLIRQATVGDIIRALMDLVVREEVLAYENQQNLDVFDQENVIPQPPPLYQPQDP
jgi:hypothetical protein